MVDYGDETQGTDNGFWRQTTGTSPAAAMTGSVASLLQGSGVHEPMAIKAVLINSADTWTSNDKPHPLSPDADPSAPNCTDPNAPDHKLVRGTGYDRSYGFGVINADEAYVQRKDIHLDEISTKSGSVKCYQGRLDAFDKATLVWEKQYEKPLAQLDFTLYSASGFGKWKKVMQDSSAVDNVKQVSNGSDLLNIDPLDTKKFLLKVSVVGETQASQGKEKFALVTAQRFDKLVESSCPE